MSDAASELFGPARWRMSGLGGGLLDFSPVDSMVSQLLWPVRKPVPI